jgi:hypothetical protein
MVSLLKGCCGFRSRLSGRKSGAVFLPDLANAAAAKRSQLLCERIVSTCRKLQALRAFALAQLACSVKEARR